MMPLWMGRGEQKEKHRMSLYTEVLMRGISIVWHWMRGSVEFEFGSSDKGKKADVGESFRSDPM